MPDVVPRTDGPRISDPRFTLQAVAATRRVSGLAEDLLEGFDRRPRTLPPKYFYDARGSELFDRICSTAEYYPTRTEAALLQSGGARVLERARPESIVELGSGTARKTRLLLEQCDRAGLACQYWPFDVCAEVLEQAAGELLEAFPWLRVNALAGDYMAGLEGLELPPGRRLFMFLGGTIGNFAPGESVAFLEEIAGLMGPDDHLLLGADRVKERGVLEAAYDDAEGVTAEFNRNLLRVLNRDLGADFDIAAFEHRALYDPDRARIEMHLVSQRDQSVSVQQLDRCYQFADGQYILTEISRKFTPQALDSELRQAGLETVLHLEPDNGYFSLVLARRG